MRTSGSLKIRTLAAAAFCTALAACALSGVTVTRVDHAHQYSPLEISATDDDKSNARMAKETAQLVEHLMGRKAERRFQFIQDNAKFAGELDV